MIEAAAPAKINLTLRVLGKRDDGFHAIETLIVPIALADRITIDAASTWSFTCTDPTVPADDTNLVVRAASLFYQTTGLENKVAITLEKHIPHGAGLGGGSSDAATTLHLLNRFHATNLPLETLTQLAAQLGSDVTVFLHASPAWCRGRGELVDPTTLAQKLPVLLLKPPFPIPTPWAYKNWKTSHPLPGVDYSTQSFQWGTLENDLERPVFEKHLLLPAIKQWLRAQHEVTGALMSGSGSTMFAILRQPGLGAPVIERAKDYFGHTLWTCETTTS